MARATVTVTSSWTQIAAGVALITVLKKGDAALLTNESATDVNADLMAKLLPEDQIQQTEALPTYVRTDGTEWTLLVNGIL